MKNGRGAAWHAYSARAGNRNEGRSFLVVGQFAAGIGQGLEMVLYHDEIAASGRLLRPFLRQGGQECPAYA